jgi:RHS repeat-associated protein
LKDNLDASALRISMTREGNQTDRYRYDATSQLTGVDYGNARAEAFTYDPLGNRIEHTDTTPGQPALVERYETNNLNQYTHVADISLSYDLNGNLIDDGKQRYTYDAQNRLVKVESAAIRAEFAYDARNRCVMRRYYKPDGQGNWVLNEADSLVLTYDIAWNLIVDRDLSGRQRTSYTHGNRVDEILMAKQDGELQYPLVDAIGSTIALGGAMDEKQGNIQYGVFGKPSNITSDHRFLYTGREWLKSIQLTEHRNRYYQPKSGRWFSCDPKYFIDGINTRAYVHNSPTNLLDAQGMMSCNSCTTMVENALADNTKAKRLMGDLLGNGCFSIIECTSQTPADNRAAEYDPSNGNITLFSGKITTGGDGIIALVHEMVHALDDCMGAMISDAEWACSEIRAYDYSGFCAGYTGAAYKNCVSDAAKQSMLMAGRDAAFVDAQYNNCTGGW